MLISLDQIGTNTRTVVIADEKSAHQTQDGVSTQIEIGELLVAVAVYAANVVKDIRENLRNLVGGRMQHYEHLVEQAVAAALADLETKAMERGYDGVVGVKISHPQVVDGGVEVIVYGNGYRYCETSRV